MFFDHNQSSSSSRYLYFQTVLHLFCNDIFTRHVRQNIHTVGVGYKRLFTLQRWASPTVGIGLSLCPVQYVLYVVVVTYSYVVAGNSTINISHLGQMIMEDGFALIS